MSDRLYPRLIACAVHLQADPDCRVCQEVAESLGEPWRGVYPGMCRDPEICRGKTHCPRDYSCCE